MRKAEKAALDVLAKSADTYNCWSILDEAVTCGDDDGFTREYIEGEREMLRMSIENAEWRRGAERDADKLCELSKVTEESLGDNAMYREMLNDAAGDYSVMRSHIELNDDIARWARTQIEMYLDLLRDAASEYGMLTDERDRYKAACEAAQSLNRDMMDGLLEGSVPATDENMAKYGWVRLPVDANGERVVMGDMLHDHEDGHDFKVDGFQIWGSADEWWAYQENGVQYPVRNCTLIRCEPDPIESIVTQHKLGNLTEQQLIDKLRDAMDGRR